MKLTLALSALAAATLTGASVCSKGAYTYEKCKFNVTCANSNTNAYDNFVYNNVTSFVSCMQQCLTGEYGCDAVNYSLRKKTCTLLIDVTGAPMAKKGVDYAAKTTSQACGNVG